MSWIKRAWAMIRRRQLELDLNDELQLHIEMKMQANIEAGMSREEARLAALKSFGGVEQKKEQCRDADRLRWVEDLIQDLRYGLRQLRRSPGFTAVAVITLALGIGATTAIFSMVNAVLLQPLPFKSSSRLVALHEGLPKLGFPKMGFSPPDLAVFARDRKSFSAIGAFQDKRVDISGRGEPERVMAARVSASLFPMLGAEPMLGRIFTEQEDAPGNNLAILSYEFWQRRYGGAARVIGQTIRIDRRPYTIIGVMPRNFEFPVRGTPDNDTPAALWVPMGFTPKELQDWGGVYLFSVLGRLRPGVTLDQARGETDSLSRRILDDYPAAIASRVRRAKGRLTITATQFQEDVAGPVRTPLLVLMGAVALVLLIACANVATLLVSRAVTRQKEVAVRTALGATRRRLFRQMLAESLVLALMGGLVGFVLAFWGRNVILALVPASIPLSRQIPLGGGILAFTLALSFLAALLFGLVPAFQVSAANLQESLQEGGRSGAAGGSRHLQGFFVMVQFALALILLVGAGLLIRSFGKLLETRPGFRPDHVLTMNIPLPREVYSHAAQVMGFYERLLDRVSDLPGVKTVGLSNDLPLHASEGVSIVVERRTNNEVKTPQAIVQSWVLGNYFQTMGIPLLQGRWFTPQDRFASQPVAVVSLSMARKLWPGQNAIGKRIRWGVYSPWETIVGIVGNVKQGPFNIPLAPHVYRPYSQLPGPFLQEDPFGDWHAMNLALRTEVDPAFLTSAVLAQVHSLDPDLAIANIRTMKQVIRTSRAGPRFNTILLGIFAGLALFLAAIGVYGVLAYAVAQRRHEIGIRMALGAQKRDVLKLVLSQGMTLALIGVGIGIAGALALTRLLSSLLYGVKPTDPLTFIAVSLILTGMALLACYIPARRATKVDPTVALRYE